MRASGPEPKEWELTMKAGRFFVAMLTVFAVGSTIGCGKNTKQKEAASLEAEGNERLRGNAASEKDLGSKYGIWVNQGVETKPAAETAKAFKWDVFSDKQRQEIRVKLQNHIANLDRVFEIADHKGMNMFNGGTVKKSHDNAQAYLDSLNAFEKKN
jgi:hypothetical protein